MSASNSVLEISLTSGRETVTASVREHVVIIDGGNAPRMLAAAPGALSRSKCCLSLLLEADRAPARCGGLAEACTRLQILNELVSCLSMERDSCSRSSAGKCAHSVRNLERTHLRGHHHGVVYDGGRPAVLDHPCRGHTDSHVSRGSCLPCLLSSPQVPWGLGRMTDAAVSQGWVQPASSGSIFSTSGGMIPATAPCVAPHGSTVSAPPWSPGSLPQGDPGAAAQGPGPWSTACEAPGFLGL